MCTATYLPLEPTGFILTHSRDEKAIRPAAHPPRTVRIGGQVVTFPQDPKGKGTWIATGQCVDQRPITVCLLNGAFTPHLSLPPYKHSRGLVILHVFAYPSIEAFCNTYDFCGVEPFTLLIAEASRLIELRWNGERLFTHEKDPHRPHIWSSVTLYTGDVIAKRESWFRDWLREHPIPSVKTIRRFHQTASDGDPENSLRMNRRDAFGHDILLTLSLTSVVHDGAGTEMVYEDFTQQCAYRQPLTRSSYATA